MNRYIAKAFDYFVVYPARQHHNSELEPNTMETSGGVYKVTQYGNECHFRWTFHNDEHLADLRANKYSWYLCISENLDRLDSVKAPVTEDTEFTL